MEMYNLDGLLHQKVDKMVLLQRMNQFQRDLSKTKSILDMKVFKKQPKHGSCDPCDQNFRGQILIRQTKRILIRGTRKGIKLKFFAKF